METLNKPKLLIWVTSGHALVVADILRLNREFEIIGFLDDVNRERYGTTFGGTVILGGQEQLDKFLDEGVHHLIVAIGDCAVRLRLGELAHNKGFDLVSALHPRSIIARDVCIGSGTIICAGAVINPGVQIGKQVIVNTSASVDHECSIGDGVYISPGVHLGGGVLVGRSTWIGIGATVIDHIKSGFISDELPCAWRFA